MWVKICGTTNMDDALMAVDAGADAVGFILVPTSPREVHRKTVSEILSVLSPTIQTVGVVANEDPGFLKSLLRVCPLNALQFHGEESPEEVRSLAGQTKLIKTIRVRDESSLEQIPQYKGVDAILLDTYHPHLKGGTGTPFDWSLAVKAKQFGIPIILAGGLDPTNVQEAIRQVDPYGVDVVSGVERSPGRKESNQVWDFVINAKQAGSASSASN